MNAKQVHLKAWDLRSELFQLTNKIKSLQQQANAANLEEETGHLDSVACQLAAIHADLPHTFVAAASEY